MLSPVQHQQRPSASWQDVAASSPAMDALFLVRFDKRKGSTVVWHRTASASRMLGSP